MKVWSWLKENINKSTECMWLAPPSPNLDFKTISTWCYGMFLDGSHCVLVLSQSSFLSKFMSRACVKRFEQNDVDLRQHGDDHIVTEENNARFYFYSLKDYPTASVGFDYVIICIDEKDVRNREFLKAFFYYGGKTRLILYVHSYGQTNSVRVVTDFEEMFAYFL